MIGQRSAAPGATSLRATAVAAAVLLLSGCTSMLVGGPAAGSHPAGADDRTAATVSADAAITTRIKGKYAADSVVSVFDIGVRSHKGVVTLQGTVGSYAARNQAETIARGTSGVSAVNNLIVVEDRSE